MFPRSFIMPANLNYGVIKVNGKYEPTPFLYSPENQTTTPPFTVNGSGDSRFVSYAVTCPAGSTVRRLNEDSALWIKKNNVWTPMWQSIVTNADGQWHVVYVFENNCTIRSMVNASGLWIAGYNAGGQQIGTTTPVVSLSITDLCISALIDSSDGAIIPIFILWTAVGVNYLCSSGGISSPNNLQILKNINILYDPYGTDENETPSGGYGDFDYTSEIETPPPLPMLSAAQVGFVSLWNPTVTEMKDLASYLWTGTFDLTNFKKLFTDPMQCVLAVGIIPITPTRKQSGGVDVKEEIVFGGSSHSGVTAYPVTEQFYIEDMGSLHIAGQSKSALDYAPYSKASIYLPYCGTYALDVDEIMDSDVYLEYHIDIYTGACVAYLTIDGHVNSDGENVQAIMYQFTGNVFASIPITGNDHSQFIQSMLIMGASVAATVASSGAGAPAIEGAAAEGDVAGAGMALNATKAGSVVNTVMSMKPNVLHSGNLSSTAGLLGGQKPFITMTWSNLCRPEDEYKLAGMPLHKSGTLSDFSGFTIVSACHMDNILCTDAERSMIERALAKGVII